MGEPGGHEAKWKRTVTEAQIPYDSSSTRDIRQPNTQKQRLEWWFPNTGKSENGEILLDGYKVSVINVLETSCTIQCYSQQDSIVHLKFPLRRKLSCQMFLTQTGKERGMKKLLKRIAIWRGRNLGENERIF